MSTNESASYQTLRNNAKEKGDRMDRVENMLGSGMPDLNWCLAPEGIEVWIEIKTPMSEPKRKATALLSGQHQLSQEQMNWLLMHHKAGGRGFVYIDAPSRRYLLPGRMGDTINGMTINELQLLSDWTAPVPTPNARWLDLRERLCDRS